MTSQTAREQELLATLPKASLKSRRSLALDDATPPAVLRELSQDKSEEVRMDVASNPNTPTDVLDRFAQSWGPETLEVIFNPSLRPETVGALNYDFLLSIAYSDVTANIAKLVGSTDWEHEYGLHLAAAGNRATPSDMLTALAGLEEVSVRTEVANNPRTPAESLADLAGDADEGVRAGVGANPSTPIATVQALSGDGSWQVRAAVEWAMWARDDSPTYGAGAPPKYPEQMETWANEARDESMADEDGWAFLSEFPAWVLAILAGYEDDDVRLWVAGNRRTPAAALTRLTWDAHEDVQALARATAAKQTRI